MKKITILAAFALMATGAFAQTDEVTFLPMVPSSANPSNYEWNGANWLMPGGVTDGKFNDDWKVWVGTFSVFDGDFGKLLFTDLANQVEDTTQFTISLNGNMDKKVSSIEINSTLRYNVTPEVRTYSITGIDGAQLVKDGEGAFYNDVELNNMTTVLKNGTLGRLNKESAESAVFGSKIAVEPGAHATLVLSDKNSTGTTYFPALNVDSLIIGDGAELDFYLPSYGKMRKDTNVYIAGKGTINFYAVGTRFFAGGTKENVAFDTDKGQWHNGSVTGANTSKWEDYAADFSGFEGKVTLQNNFEENDSTVSLFILGKGNGHTNDFVSKLEGDSTVYNVWRAAKVGDPENTDILNSICVDWKDIDLEIDNLGALSCSSTGGGTTLVRTRSLTLKPKGMVIGYYKDSNPNMIIMTGSDDRDRDIEGTFSAAKKNGSDQEGYQIWNACGAGLIKEGHGTYRITAIDNTFLKGIDVYEGGVMFNNPDPENTSATGQAQSGATVICREYGHIGGTGTIGGLTELYGTLYPGDESVSAFRIDGSHAERSSYAKAGSGIPNNIASGNYFYKAKTSKDTTITVVDGKPDTTIVTLTDTAYCGNVRGKGSDANLYLHNGAKMVFDVNGKDDHDTLLVQRTIRLMEEGAEIEIGLNPRGAYSVAEGDTIVLIESYNAYYTTKSDSIVGPKSFKLELTGFGDVTFTLDTTWVARVTRTDVGEDGTPVTKEIVPSKWQLVAVATKAGNGTHEPAGIQEPETEAETMQVYPNPAVDNVTVALPADVTGTVVIYNLAGQVVKSVSTTEAAITVNVDDLAAGVYTVKVQTGDKSYAQRLIVK